MMTLALTFARPVFPRQRDDWMGTGQVISDYNPIELFEREDSERAQAVQRYYAPGWARLRGEYG